MEESLWRKVTLTISDNLSSCIGMVEEAFNLMCLTFLRRVQFLDISTTPDQDPLDWKNVADQEADLVDLYNINPQEIKLMTYCHGLKDDNLSLKYLNLGPSQVGNRRNKSSECTLPHLA